MNRKGVIGGLIVSVPVMILVFLIMAGFILLAVFASGFIGGGKSVSAVFSSGAENINYLLSPVKFDNPDEQSEEILYIDFLKKVMNKELSSDYVYNDFFSPVDETKDCILVDILGLGITDFPLVGYKDSRIIGKYGNSLSDERKVLILKGFHSLKEPDKEIRLDFYHEDCQNFLNGGKNEQ